MQNTPPYTQSQQATLLKLRQLAQLQYSGMTLDGKLSCRLNPLIAGPTGSGKSFLVAQIAKECEAHYIKVTYGDWIVQGARSELPGTLEKVMEAVVNHPRVLLHIDELDKVTSDPTREVTPWGRSVVSDIWNVLDYRLPEKMDSESVCLLGDDVTDTLDSMIHRRLWIVGSGTWQEIFEAESEARPGVGFAPVCNTPSSNESMQEKIIRSNIIPRELTARFFGEILILQYPRSREEIEQLLQHFGVNELATKVGKTIDVSAIEKQIPFQGMRAFETLKTRLFTEQLGNSCWNVSDRKGFSDKEQNEDSLEFSDDILSLFFN